MPESAARPRRGLGTRPRSFGGCGTCRSRHVKCDEVKPSCRKCSESGLSCSGYETSIFFEHDSGAIGESGVFRRPLLTVEQRKRMSEAIVQANPPASTISTILRIDEDFEKAEGKSNFHVSSGYFGAFASARSQIFDLSVRDLEGDTFVNEAALEFVPDLSIRTSSLCDTLISPDTIDMDVQTQNHSQMNFWPLPDRLFEDTLLADLATFTSDMSYSDTSQPWPDSLAESSLVVAPASSHASIISQDIVFLLRHYTDIVIPSLSPFRHTKTPWHVLFLPQTKSCLAALTLGEHIDHATCCTFYGTLSLSAYSLSKKSAFDAYLQQARKYETLLERHALHTLETAYVVPKVAKYKSILMALLSAVQVAMFTGKRERTEFYLLEAEKFIRLRGLDRRKSRKVRLLHHCYVYMRMFHESALTGGIESGQRKLIQNAVESSGLIVLGQDNIKFRLMSCNNLELEMQRVKSQIEGENDLHLGQAGIFHATMYPEIYGIPESWFYLLSQVIRLGNERDVLRKQNEVSVIGFEDYFTRAKALERCITQLATQHYSSTCSGVSDALVLQHILHGMQNALLIYFYRRIHDLEPALLREKVTSIRDWLLASEKSGDGMVQGNVGMLWPASIAAREAEDGELREAFAGWFDRSATRTGLICFSEALDTVQQTWRERDAVARRQYTTAVTNVQGTILP